MDLLKTVDKNRYLHIYCKGGCGLPDIYIIRLSAFEGDGVCESVAISSLSDILLTNSRAKIVLKFCTDNLI